MKRFLSLVLATIMITTIMPINIFAATNIASGVCGDSLIWTLDSEGTFTVSGTGDMDSYSYSAVPWQSYQSKIKSVYINEGVTGVGDYAFFWCTSISDLSIADSVTQIGEFAFGACESLTSVTISAGVSSIGYGAFDCCHNLQSVHIMSPNVTIFDDACTINSSATIYGYEGSTAQAYAEKYNRTFISLHKCIYGDWQALDDNNHIRYCTDENCNLSEIQQHVFADSYDLCCDSCGYISQYEGQYIRVELNKTEYQVGDIVVATVYVDYNVEISSAGIAYGFDESVLSFVESESSWLISGQLTSLKDAYGRYRAAWMGEYDEDLSANTSGVLKLAFRVTGTCLNTSTLLTCNFTTSNTVNEVSVATVNIVHTYDDWQKYNSDEHIRYCVNDFGCDSFETADHVWNDGVVTTEPACATTGNKAFTCTDCGAAYTESIPATGNHTYGDWQKLDDDKHIHYCTGTDCEASETADHVWNNGEITIEPTCATTGNKTFTCTDCGATYTESIPATGNHTYGDWQKYDGDKHIHYCTGADCEASETADHVWNSGIVTTEPTCATEGVKTYTCTDCGATYTESIPATGNHTYGNWQKHDDDKHIHYCTGTDCNASETASHEYANKFDTSCEICEHVRELDNSIANGMCGENLYWSLSADGVLTISGIGAMTNYGSGSAPWYSYSSLITTVVVENGMTSIGDYAFWGCSSLTGIDIPDSVTSIGHGAFVNCSSLTEVTIPDSITSIGYGAFVNCSSLTSITIPNSVTSIGDEAFRRCSNLTSITIPNSVTSIGMNAFRGCSSLTSITIPNGVTSIGGSAFSDCSSLMSVTFKSATTEVYDSGDTISDTATICGYTGSAAQAYAEKYGREFVTLCDGDHAYGDWQKLDADKHIHYCTSTDCNASETADHVWNNGVVTTQPTCATEGIKTFTCTDCGATYTEVVPATGNHTYGDWQKFDGNAHVRYCTSDDCYAYETSNHNWNHGVVTTEPTCATNGVNTFTCTDCDATYTESVPATGEHVYGDWQKHNDDKHIHYCTGTDCEASETADHVWNNGVVTTEPTCATDGVKTFTCSDCGATYTESVPATCEHIYSNWQKLDDYNHIRYCTGTDCETSETVDHNWNDGIVTTQPTCAIDGVKTFTCTDCGATYTESIPATGKHTYGGWQKLNANKHVHYCETTACESLEVADHNWNDGVVTTEPTCATEGVKTFTCSDCGATYTESIPATGNHTYGDWQKYDGDMHIHYCTSTDCNASETADHVWNDGVVTTEPTCATESVKTFTCSDCGATYTESVPATGNHTYGDWQKLNANKHVHYCETTACESLEVADHNWNDGEVSTEPACSTDGVKTYTCSDCSATYTESVFATGKHTYGGWQKLDNDKHIHYCTGTDCNVSETLNHSWDNGTKVGIEMVYSCTDCEAEQRETLVAKGDVNDDGSVDKNDAIYLLYSVLFGDSQYPLNQTCDFNGDGSVDKNDAIYLLYHALFGAVSYPLN